MRTTHSSKSIVLGLSVLAASANAATLTATDDTIILQNGAPGSTEATSADAEENFGGRTEMIIGPNNGSPRHGLFRFDVTSLAAQINDVGQTVDTVTFTLYERSGRNGIQPGGSTTLSIAPIVAGNAGWVEGTATGSTGAWNGGGSLNSVSMHYHTTPTNFGDTDGQQWLSAGGGPTPAGTAPSSTFTVGTDTAAALGTITVTNTGDANDVWTGTLDAAAVEALLPSWLADPTGNAGIAVTYESGSTGQWFFGSVESGAGTDPAAELDITFVPEPSVALLGGLGLLGLLRRRRA
ncbi:MAG: PEP-CTERM sorting domain-containing protein [Verrucomicrobiota bacterium]